MTVHPVLASFFSITINKSAEKHKLENNGRHRIPPVWDEGLSSPGLDSVQEPHGLPEEEADKADWGLGRHNDEDWKAGAGTGERPAAASKQAGRNRVAAAAVSGTTRTAAFVLEEATIESIHRALAESTVRSHGLVGLYMRRIASVDPTLSPPVSAAAPSAAPPPRSTTAAWSPHQNSRVGRHQRVCVDEMARRHAAPFLLTHQFQFKTGDEEEDGPELETSVAAFATGPGIK